MRTFDLAPLYRSTVGFDRLFSMLDGFEAAPGYPPYNIERTGENDYRITVAVAGFGENELSIESKENTLTIKGEKQVKQDNNGEVLYQGIAARAFERAVPACRLRPGEGRQPRERSPARRPRARDSRGEEAPPDRHRQRQGQAAGGRDQGRGLIEQPDVNSSGSSAEWSAPELPGRFHFVGDVQCGVSSRGRGCLGGAGCGLRPAARRAGCADRPWRAGLGFGSGACFGGAAAARFTGLGFGGGAGAARCGKRSGGGGSMPPRSGSAVMTFGSDGGEILVASRGIASHRRGGGGAASLIATAARPASHPAARGTSGLPAAGFVVSHRQPARRRDSRPVAPDDRHPADGTHSPAASARRVPCVHAAARRRHSRRGLRPASPTATSPERALTTTRTSRSSSSIARST